jgi:hypothetical protein
MLARSKAPLFSGYRAEIIAEWCNVSLSTAHAYKAGRCKPGRHVKRLFELHRDRHVMPASWRRDGWIFNGEVLVDPEGKELPTGLLRNYQLMLQYFHDLACRTGDEEEVRKYWEFLKAA